jgi:hypothetical protein
MNNQNTIELCASFAALREENIRGEQKNNPETNESYGANKKTTPKKN